MTNPPTPETPRRPEEELPLSTTPNRREILIALATCFDLPRPVACRLARSLDTWRAAGWGSGSATAQVLGVPADALTVARGLLDRAAAVARREVHRTAELGGEVVALGEPAYPSALADLELPPAALFVRGRLPASGPEGAVAVVGSRRADPYGKEVAGLFARQLSEAGLTVVSGFARGIDAAAHRGALEAEAAGDCATVAVLGSGLGVDYPRGHRRLGEAIAERGALLSEFPPGLEPKAWHFPVRNRLIAALAAAVLVVRAAPRSGSLVTARLALDLGREVFAVPGRIFEERSLGTNALIADGAQVALHPRDLLERLGVPAGKPAPAPGAGSGADEGTLPKGFAGEVLAALTPGEETAPETVAARLGRSVDRVLGTLLELELAGRVRRYPGPAYVRRP